MIRNDFFEYRLLSGNKANRTELESETLPFTFKSNSHKLRNYRIYGNENGIGDLQENGKYLIPVTIKGKNLFDENSNLITPCSLATSGAAFPGSTGGERRTVFMYVEPNTTYTFSAVSSGDRIGITEYNNKINPNDYIGVTNPSQRLQPNRIIQEASGITPGESYSVSFTTSANAKMVAIYYSYEIIPSSIQIEVGSATTVYESYHEPKTVDIYLDETLNDGDYIDFREQKRFNGDDTSETVALPVLPIVDGTNIISIDTENQPSKVYIQGKIEIVEETEVPVSLSVQASPKMTIPLKNFETGGVELAE